MSVPFVFKFAVQLQGILPKRLRHFSPVPSPNAVLPQIRPRSLLPLPFPINFFTDHPITLATEGVVSFEIERQFCRTSQFHYKSPNYTLSSFTNHQIALSVPLQITKLHSHFNYKSPNYTFSSFTNHIITLSVPLQITKLHSQFP